MATAIRIGYCGGCGQLKAMKSFEIAEGHRRLIEVYCPCGAEETETTDLPLYEEYYLEVEVKREEPAHDDSDQGDVQTGGEAGRESDA